MSKMDKTAASAPPAENKRAATSAAAAAPATAAGAAPKKPPSPEKMKATLRAAEERCVGLQERARFLVRPDVFRKVDELERMAAEQSDRLKRMDAEVERRIVSIKVERRIVDQTSKLDAAEPEKEEGEDKEAESADKPMETEEPAKKNV